MAFRQAIWSSFSFIVCKMHRLDKMTSYSLSKSYKRKTLGGKQAGRQGGREVGRYEGRRREGKGGKRKWIISSLAIAVWL